MSVKTDKSTEMMATGLLTQFTRLLFCMFVGQPFTGTSTFISNLLRNESPTLPMTFSRIFGNGLVVRGVNQSERGLVHVELKQLYTLVPEQRVTGRLTQIVLNVMNYLGLGDCVFCESIRWTTLSNRVSEDVAIAATSAATSHWMTLLNKDSDDVEIETSAAATKVVSAFNLHQMTLLNRNSNDVETAPCLATIKAENLEKVSAIIVAEDSALSAVTTAVGAASPYRIILLNKDSDDVEIETSAAATKVVSGLNLHQMTLLNRNSNDVETAACLATIKAENLERASATNAAEDLGSTAAVTAATAASALGLASPHWMTWLNKGSDGSSQRNCLMHFVKSGFSIKFILCELLLRTYSIVVIPVSYRGEALNDLRQSFREKSFGLALIDLWKYTLGAFEYLDTEFQEIWLRGLFHLKRFLLKTRFTWKYFNHQV